MCIYNIYYIKACSQRVFRRPSKKLSITLRKRAKLRFRRFLLFILYPLSIWILFHNWMWPFLIFNNLFILKLLWTPSQCLPHHCPCILDGDECQTHTPTCFLHALTLQPRSSEVLPAHFHSGRWPSHPAVSKCSSAPPPPPAAFPTPPPDPGCSLRF